uniref:Uncharacterized protein n=1 Tax=Salvator merianae TaxID=96440 RepID=A0A8D0C4E2_SALMN
MTSRLWSKATFAGSRTRGITLLFGKLEVFILVVKLNFTRTKIVPLCTKQKSIQ